MTGSGLTEEARQIVWYTRIRGTILFYITAIVILAKLIGLSFPFIPVLLLIASAVLYNLGIIFFIRLRPGICGKPLAVYFYSLLDIIVITLLLNFTGGQESPFAALYLLSPALIAMFYGTTLAILLAGHAAIIFNALGILEAFRILPHHDLIQPLEAHIPDLRFTFINSTSLFFIALALIYALSYLSEKFREKQKQVEQLFAEKTDFMNDVAHELRSPLTSIKEYTSLFLEGLLGEIPQNQKDALEVIRRQSRRMTDMVTDLLDLARIESGLARFALKEAYLPQIIENVVTEMMPQFDLNKIILLQDLKANLPPVKVDEAELLEVFINLFSNAVKFSKEGGKITLSAKKSAEGILVSIKDEGQGISSEDLPHIFEKFYRAKRESTAQKGTGLGLALCKSILERHGGHIWAESEGLGKGATFYFTLPLK
jgi:signal transduction histidine kinase